MEDCVSLRRILLYVPSSSCLSVDEWTPEDTEFALQVGSMALKCSKETMTDRTYAEVLRAVECKYESQLKDMDRNLLVQKEISKMMETEQDMVLQKRLADMRQVFDSMMESYGKEREETRVRMLNLEMENARMRQLQSNQQTELEERIHREAAQKASYELDRMREMLSEKDRQVNMHRELMETYGKEREEMRVRLLNLEMENAKHRELEDDKINREALKKVARELDRMREMLSEKDKQVNAHRDLFEMSIKKLDTMTQKRDVASIGKVGEGQFRKLAINTFRDFDGFQLREVCSIGGLGDFHLEFKEMSILVDSKLYTNKVNSTSRDKIKRDLLNNEHMNFAWLVSMDTYVDRFDKAPFMFEWLNPEKCVVYINCLNRQEEPSEVLRSVWYCCRAIRQMMESGGAEKGELSLLKEKEMKMCDILSKMSKNNRERDTLMGQLRRNFDKADEYMREILNDETAAVVNDYYRVVVEWWNHNLEEFPGGSMKSTAIWTQFKRDVKGVDMDANAFKDVLCGFLGSERVNKPKVKGGALDILGYKFCNS